MRLPRDRRCGPTWRRLPQCCLPDGVDHHEPEQPAAEPVAEAPLRAGSGLLGLGTPRQREARQPHAAAASSMSWTRGGGASTTTTAGCVRF